MSENTFAVGDRVQVVEDDELITGTIQLLFSKEEEDGSVEYASVHWDGLAEDELEDWELDLLEPEGTQDELEDELEVEFQKVYEKHADQIHEQLEIASKAIAKAEKIAEKYGIPFSASVSPLGQSYFPASFPEKFGELSLNFVSDLTGAYSEYANDGCGWEHSSIC